MNPAELHRRVFDFRFAAAVFAGVDLGLFPLLAAGPLSAAELAQRAGCDERAITIWLRSLTAAGVVQTASPSEDKQPLWELAPELAPCFEPHGAQSLSHLFQHDLWHWTRWGGLTESLRTGLPQDRHEGDRHLSDPNVLRRFLPNYVEAMRESGRDATAELAARIAKLGPRRLIDFGGGGGDLLIAACHQLPELRACLVEHRFSLDVAAERIRVAGLAARIELVELDFERQLIDGGPLALPFDVAVLSRVLMGFSPARARAAIGRIAERLSPGGVLMVHDFAEEVHVGGMLGLDMLLNTGGQVHAGDQIRGWMREAGLEDLDERPVLAQTRLWTGRRRSA